MQTHSLKNQLLIAMPGLADPNFFHSVTFICEHTDSGAMGIVINRPTDIRIGEVLEQMDIKTASGEAMQRKVFLGGPVEEQRGFVLHSGRRGWDSTLRITADLSVTTSRDILEAMARGEGPERALVALGYAGWGEGQLEQELLDNAWLTAPANQAILFELPPEQRWQAAAELLGIDLATLSSDSGHA